jgi:ABC-type multidrug transport system fused ATPase/permease subunit
MDPSFFMFRLFDHNLTIFLCKTVYELFIRCLSWGYSVDQNAYQNLQGLVTSFTRSAAGAEKIFSLWDSEPDIDPSKGSDVSWDVKGRIELRGVQFFYQMRPDNIVLNDFHLDIPAGKTIALGKSQHFRKTSSMH